MANASSRTSGFESLPRRRALGSLALAALPAVVLGVVGFGYLRHEAGIAERELNDAANAFARELAIKLEDGLEAYLDSSAVRLRTLSSQDYYKTGTPDPRISAANREAFAKYEAALENPENGRELLEAEVDGFVERFTPAGLPLKPLAEYQLARLASEAGDGRAVVEWSRKTLESGIETHPSAISESLIDRVAALARANGIEEEVRIAHWQARWKQSNRTRALLRRNIDKLRSNLNVSRWFREGGEAYFWDLRSSGETLVLSMSELETLTGELIADEIFRGGPGRFPLAVRITFGRRAFKDIVPAPLNDPAQREAWFQQLGYNPITTHHMEGLVIRGWGDPSNSSVRISSADPDAFRAAVRRRVWTQGGFLGVVMLLLGAGIWRTWRAMETQRRLNEQQSDFLSSVSHELRAPVAGIRLLSERLADGKGDSGEREEYAHLIGREAGRLGTLVSNVLDVTRIGQGRKSYEFEPADIKALVSDTVERMRPLAGERKIIIAVDIDFPDPQSDPVIDAVAIQQALGNLIDNAIKFSPEGGTIGVRLDSPEGGGFALSVSDEGPGISADEQKKIFDRFYRVGSELLRETQGAGIGLSLVRHIAEAHAGTVSVDSTPGKGSRFVLRIPARVIND